MLNIIVSKKSLIAPNAVEVLRTAISASGILTGSSSQFRNLLNIVGSW